MNDLDELLRTDARDWQPPHAPVPDLDAALARVSAKRSRLTAGAALVTMVALAAGGVVVANQLAGVPAVPDPLGRPSVPATAPPTTPPVTPTPVPSEPASSLATLSDAVHEYAIQHGIPAQVDVVRSTWLAAQEFLPASGDEPTDGVPGDTPVWLVQVQGGFTCDDCQTTQQGPEPTVSTLTMVLRTDSLERIWYEMGDVTRPLHRLGRVVALDPDGNA